MTGVELLKLILGGAAIGGAVSILLLLNGRIAGISGIYSDAIRMQFGPVYWRLAFIVGLIVPAAYLVMEKTPIEFSVNSYALAFAGLLVGVGTDLGSGHSVCGIAKRIAN